MRSYGSEEVNSCATRESHSTIDSFKSSNNTEASCKLVDRPSLPFEASNTGVVVDADNDDEIFPKSSQELKILDVSKVDDVKASVGGDDSNTLLFEDRPVSPERIQTGEDLVLHVYECQGCFRPRTRKRDMPQKSIVSIMFPNFRACRQRSRQLLASKLRT